MTTRYRRCRQDLCFVFGVLMLNLLHVMVESSRNCPQSSMTVKYVDGCPGTREDWMDAVVKKNCSGIKQECVASEHFQYHCVINSFINSTVEVCAPTWFCIGFCAEYNMQGQRIQDNFNAPCTTFADPCPPRYKSSEAYLYQECYSLLEKKSFSVITTEEKMRQDNDVPNKGTSTIIIASTICYLAGLLLVLAFILYKRRNEKRSNAQRNVNEEIQDDEQLMAEPQNI